MITSGSESGGSQRLFTFALAWSLISLCLLCAVLATFRIDPNIGQSEGEYNLKSLWSLWIVSGCVWIGLSGLFFHLARSKKRAEGGNWVRVALFIVLTSAAVRCVVVILHEPSLSDDIWRYIYDGRNLANGVNPYLALPDNSEKLRPDDVFVYPPADAIPFEQVMEHWRGESVIAKRVNNGELHTIYLPFSQIVFYIGGKLCDSGLINQHDPLSNMHVFKSMFAVIDIGLIILLLVVLKYLKRNPWWVCLYAWHPLPIIEIAGSGHQDIIGIVLLFLSVYLAVRGLKKLSIMKWVPALAFASMVKPFVIPVAAFALRGKPMKMWIGAAVTGAILCGAFLSPLYFSKDHQPLDNLVDTSERFSLKWAHFGSIYEPVLWSIEQATNDPQEAWDNPELWTNDDQEKLARLICMIGILISGMLIFFKVKDIWSACRLFLFVLVLFTPAAHPWYLLWVLIFMPIRPSISLWIASLSILWGYAAWSYAETDDGLRWGVDGLVIMLAYVPVYVALLIEFICKMRSCKLTRLKEG